MSTISNGSSTNRSPVLLVVEPDEALTEQIVAFFHAAGWSSYCFKCGRDALEQLNAIGPTMVLLNLDLPDVAGLHFLAEILGEDASVPVITTSDHYKQSLVRAALRLGAIDYIGKPLYGSELMRRAQLCFGNGSKADRAPQSDLIVVDETRRVVHIGGKFVHLPPKTFDVLAYLVRHKGRVVLQRELVAVVAHTSIELHTRRVEYHIAFLRRVFRERGLVDNIRTVRSRGYEWSTD